MLLGSAMHHITAEQVRSRVRQAEAALIDPSGVVVTVADGTIVGRDPAMCDLAVLDASVSVVHARFARLGGAWSVLDLGSRNGTTVDGARAAPRAALAAGARVCLGDVAFCFWPLGEALVLAGAAGLVEVLRRGDGALVRGAGRAASLTARELRLLELLVARRVVAGSVELAFLASGEIAISVGFESIDADGDNVRELVHRLRRKLAAAGAADLVQSRRGAGYRLAAAVGAVDHGRLAA